MESSRIDRLARFLGTLRYDGTSEARMQEGLERQLQARGLTCAREVILSPADRIDFLVGDLGIELKIDGTPSDVLSQVIRYLKLPRLAGLVLITTRARITSGFPLEIPVDGIVKPLRIVETWRSAL